VFFACIILHLHYDKDYIRSYFVNREECQAVSGILVMVIKWYSSS